LIETGFFFSTRDFRCAASSLVDSGGGDLDFCGGENESEKGMSELYKRHAQAIKKADGRSGIGPQLISFHLEIDLQPKLELTRGAQSVRSRLEGGTKR
jgi:hypothetical protein